MNRNREVDLERMSSEEREKYLNQRLGKSIQNIYEKSPFIKAKLDRAGVTPSQVNSVKALEMLPITRKDELIKLQRAEPPFGGLLAIPTEEVRRIFVSPGPIYEVVEDYSPYAESMKAAGFGKGDIVIVTFSYHLVPAGLIADEALRLLGSTVIPAGTGNTELQVQIMHDLKVTGYVGTPSFLMALIKRAEEHGYNFRKDFALRRACFTAEPLPESLRKSFQEEYGILTTQAYGTAEVGVIAYECSEKQGMHVASSVILEIVDPVTGKQLGPGRLGEIVVTLFGAQYPFVRYGTGDVSYYTDELCPCGRTSPRLVRVAGRVGDAVKVRGMFIHASQVEEALSEFPQLSKFQVVVTRSGIRDELILRVELQEEVDREKLLKEVRARVKDICQVKADTIDFISRGTLREGYKRIDDRRSWE